MTWTRLEGTPLWTLARAHYQSDPRRKHHEWSHILRLYHHAEQTFALSHDPELDKAILAHDIIYDEHPDKEKRSADWLLAHDPSSGACEYQHIMKTRTHEVTEDNRMVLLDLADFMFDECVIENRARVEAESIALYGIDTKAFARANAEFLEKMISSYAPGALAALPQWERDAFTRIRAGLQRTIDLSRAALGA